MFRASDDRLGHRVRPLRLRATDHAASTPNRIGGLPPIFFGVPCIIPLTLIRDGLIVRGMTTLHTADIHTARIMAWANYNGQRGTAKQIDRLLKSFPPAATDTLDRMLRQRGIVIQGAK